MAKRSGRYCTFIEFGNFQISKQLNMRFGGGGVKSTVVVVAGTSFEGPLRRNRYFRLVVARRAAPAAALTIHYTIACQTVLSSFFTTLPPDSQTSILGGTGCSCSSRYTVVLRSRALDYRNPRAGLYRGPEAVSDMYEKHLNFQNKLHAYIHLHYIYL